MLKNKLTPDEIAMIIVDFLDGELTTCKDVECENCPLHKKIELDGDYSKTICNIMVKSAKALEENE